MKFLVLSALLVMALSAQGREIKQDVEIPYPFAGFTGGNQPCYTNPSNGKTGGLCIQSDCCSGSLYISNLCPNYQANVKCCYSSNSCNLSNTGTCSTTVKNLACEILSLHEQGKIYLKGEHFDARGNNPYDGASSLSNIRDTCYGYMAKRSSYDPPYTKGGYICLTSKMLTSLRDYATSFYNTNKRAIEVNALAGSSHSATSWHYEGNTFDVACTTPINHCTALKNWCLNQSPVEACYPNGPCAGHDTWVHCAH